MADFVKTGKSVSFNGSSRLYKSGITMTKTKLFFRGIVDLTTTATGSRVPIDIKSDASDYGFAFMFYHADTYTNVQSYLYTSTSNVSTAISIPSRTASDTIGKMVLTAVWDGSTFAWFINGVRVSVKDISGNMVLTSKGVAIGAIYGGWYYWIGLVDDVILSFDNMPSDITPTTDSYDEWWQNAENFCADHNFNPDHIWTFDDDSNIGKDTGSIGGWDLTNYGSPAQGDPLAGYHRVNPKATVLEANLDNKILKAEIT